jgi:penicillin-binding protein 1C
LFKRAGLPRSLPPTYEPNCQGEELIGNAPLISSPQNSIVYQLEDQRKTVPLSAVTDGDSTRTFWFVDDSFVGDSAPSETFFWKAHAGQFLIRAVDSQGRANQVEVRIVENW